MIRKCINTIKYGTAKARAIVLLSLLFGIGAVGAVVCAIVFRQILFIFAAVVCAFIVITLAQTLVIQGGVVEDAGNAETREKRQSKRAKAQDADEESQAVEDGSKLKEASEVEDKHDKHKRKKQQTKEVDDAGQMAQDKQEQVESESIVPLTQETVTTYDRKKVKKTLHKFKVRREHRMIFVDRSEKLKANQTPAYIWVEKKDFHLLLIEQEPRHITIPLYQIKNITYLKKQPANEDIDYAAYKGSSVLADMFRPYLPDYSHSTVVDDLSAYKNLYGIGNDIYVTNRSASALFDLLGVEFQVDDRVTMSNKVNIYFKEAYKSNILLRDNVIDANGYADRISKTLDNLAHSTISYAEFKDTLNLMIRNKLITQEFASYYMGVRDDLTR
ncbi:hypothetical protein [Eubacterium sp. MSJ-33]|uniref:hypothetical protein n=1 Tax=Eubacterium sp. MSJ-33 TaxID=2841528 RepID=UPI001C7513C8|nr:hypothetical protein [Eubacterium sp. MSJ-33]QWT53241.1 hypothetical protein KP625_01015 [Eubacterium sp. MSJ-33]